MRRLLLLALVVLCWVVACDLAALSLSLAL